MTHELLQQPSAEESGDELMREEPDSSAEELMREEPERRQHSVLRFTICMLIITAMLAVLLVVIFMPVLKIYGGSMMPTLQEGNIVLTVKTTDVEPGEVIAFYYNNKILIKRVIAEGGDLVNIEEDGSVYVNGTKLEEPYLTEIALGECNIEMPYRVPPSHLFVMGDSRIESVDSRNTAVGCVSQDQIIGRIALRIWPLNEFGKVK